MNTKTQKTLKPWSRFYTQAYNILYNEGDKILNHILKNSAEKPEAMTIILLLRKMIELAYGHMSLVRNNEFILSKSLNREAFETSLFLEYFSETNTRERALSYQIHGLKERIKYHETFIPDHKIFKIYQEGLEKLKVDKLTPSERDISELKGEIERLNLLLKSHPLKETYEKYFENNNKLKWYSIDIKGINSLKDLAQHLNKEVIYLTIYRDYSEYIHGYNLVKNDIIKNSDNNGYIELFGIPAPPVNIAHDFLFFQVMFMDSVKSSYISLKLKESMLIENLFNRVNKHFTDHKIIRGSEFIVGDKMQKFPKIK